MGLFILGLARLRISFNFPGNCMYCIVCTYVHTYILCTYCTSDKCSPTRKCCESYACFSVSFASWAPRCHRLCLTSHHRYIQCQRDLPCFCLFLPTAANLHTYVCMYVCMYVHTFRERYRCRPPGHGQVLVWASVRLTSYTPGASPCTRSPGRFPVL